MAKRNRSIRLEFWVSADELAAMQEKMKQMGTANLSHYLRKMAMDGYVVRLDLSELRDISSKLRYAGNNLNQLAKRANTGGRVYKEDIEDVQQRMDEIYSIIRNLLGAVTALP